MLTERAPKKRKTRSGCTGIELTSAFLVLQRFRETITTPELDDEGSELEVEIDPTTEEDALSQLDNLLQWMESKMKSSTKVC